MSKNREKKEEMILSDKVDLLHVEKVHLREKRGFTHSSLKDTLS